jgi:hypothetical protein
LFVICNKLLINIELPGSVYQVNAQCGWYQLSHYSGAVTGPGFSPKQHDEYDVDLYSGGS